MNENAFDIILGDFFEVNKPNYTGNQNWINKREPHEQGHIDLITAGESEVQINGKKYHTHKGCILCIPKNTKYTVVVKNSAISYYSFHFTYSTGSENTDFPFPIVFEPENVQYYLDNYRHAYNLYNITKTYGYKVEIREIFYDIVSKITEEHYNSISTGGYYAIRKSIDFIHNSFADQNIDLKKIAFYSNITDTHFRRIFKNIYGTTPVKYINKLRINKAKSLLVNTNLSIEEISYKCGYNDYSYFARVFNKITGVSPSSFRSKFYNTIL